MALIHQLWSRCTHAGCHFEFVIMIKFVATVLAGAALVRPPDLTSDQPL
jgi:hypothetical protein